MYLQVCRFHVDLSLSESALLRMLLLSRFGVLLVSSSGLMLNGQRIYCSRPIYLNLYRHCLLAAVVLCLRVVLCFEWAKNVRRSVAHDDRFFVSLSPHWSLGEKIVVISARWCGHFVLQLEVRRCVYRASRTRRGLDRTRRRSIYYFLAK